LENTVKIYLGDLTYDTVGLSTEVFPLNIGYIGSYCKKIFGDKVELVLFKYIDKLEKAINDSPPDIIGLSNYAWCYKISLEMFRKTLEKNPNTITVWGGPNFPKDMPSQEEFMKNHTEVDFYVPIDGETGFTNIVTKYLELSSKEKIKKKIFNIPIEGCLSQNESGKLQYNNPGIRIKDLDEVPSPYLSGILDEFFDGKLSPMIQSNRGCPFSCTFCTDGSDLVKQVNKFSIDRVKNELEYIAKKVPKNIHSMTISDLNFGMYPRDLEICQTISDCQKKYEYPNIIQASTGKNQKEKIINAIKSLNGALRLSMSVQSMDQEVLENIRRSNISVDQMLALAPAIEEEKLGTTAEVILGLPGETYKSHIQTLRDLVKSNLNYVRPYTLMLLHGSEMNTPEQREKWQFKTKFRILPKDFVKLSDGKKIIETEEVVISTSTLNFEEYIDLRLLAFIMFVTNIGLVYDPLTRFLRERNIDVFDLFYNTLKQKDSAPKEVSQILEKFKQATINELWDSPEDIEKNYQNDVEFNKLLNGEDGINVLQHYQAVLIFENLEEWTEYTLKIAENLLIQKNEFDLETKEEFEDISNYCRGLSFKPLNINRMELSPEYSFHYNIKKWLENPKKDLKYFKEDLIKIKFSFTKDQFKIVEDALNMCGNTSVGKSRIFRWIQPDAIWRVPFELKNTI
jgi:radical SAM superfamily enzyme YgiQ (UPF0313 family)